MREEHDQHYDGGLYFHLYYGTFQSIWLNSRDVSVSPNILQLLETELRPLCPYVSALPWLCLPGKSGVFLLYHQGLLVSLTYVCLIINKMYVSLRKHNKKQADNKLNKYVDYDRDRKQAQTCILLIP